MAVTVSGKNLTSINTCEDRTQWTGSTPADVTAFYREGSQCVGFTMKTSGTNDSYISGSWNLTNKHLHFWFMTTALKEMTTVQVSLYDGTNTGYYTVTTAATYPGGWFNVVLDCDRTPDGGSQPTLTTITQIGIRLNLSASSKNVQNTWVDFLWVGDGLISYGDTGPGGAYDFDDILSADENTTNGWGVIRKIAGVYFLNAALDFGDTVSTNNCDFADSSEVVVFEDRPVATTYYGITIAGNSTGTTEFALGTKSGTQGISGCTIRVSSLSQTPKWFLDADDSNIDVFQLYGCTLVDHNLVELPVEDAVTPANREVVSCTFESGNNEVEVSTCYVKYCNFISSAGVAVEIDNPTTHNVSDCNFIACQTGVDCTAQGNYTFNNLVFTGCTYDIENSVDATTCDSYSESNQDGATSLFNAAFGNTGAAQSFTGDGNKLTSVSFYLKKVGSPTGNIVANLYTHTGTFGTNSKPTTPLLAASKPIDVSTLGASYAVVKFDFDDSEFYTLGNGTYYVIALEYLGGDASNGVDVGNDGSSPTHGGNWSYRPAGGNWIGLSNKDHCFYATTGGDVTINASGTSNPDEDKTNETGTPAGTTNVNSTSTIKFDKMKDNTEVRVYKTGTNEEIDGIEDATAGSQDNRNFSWTYDVGGVVDYVLHNFQPGVVVYETIRVEGYTVPSANVTIDIQQRIDRNVDTS